MTTIFLTKGQATNVDDADYKELRKVKWHSIRGTSGRTHYAFNTNKGLMHRVIMGLPKGDPRCVDHIDYDGLNNLRSNLRICTKRENNTHSRKHQKLTSSYKGVSKKYENGTWRWYSSIRVNGRIVYIGRFETELEAAVAYDKVADKDHGQFAQLNFPTPVGHLLLENKKLKDSIKIAVEAMAKHLEDNHGGVDADYDDGSTKELQQALKEVSK